jgi:hypothetical protein
MNEELKGCSLADVLEKLEKGKLGHRAAMEWLNLKSYDNLVEIMHANGRLMPGHQPMRVAPETRALLRRIFRPGASPEYPTTRSAPVLRSRCFLQPLWPRACPYRNMRPSGGRPRRIWPTVSKWTGRPWPCWVPAWMSRRRRSNGFSLKIAFEPATL